MIDHPATSLMNSDMSLIDSILITRSTEYVCVECKKTRETVMPKYMLGNGEQVIDFIIT